MEKSQPFNNKIINSPSGQEASQYARSLIEASLGPLVTIGPEEFRKIWLRCCSRLFYE